MANKVTIDVEARYYDRVSAGMNATAKSADKLKKSVNEANKELDKASKKTVKPKLGADDNAFTKKIRQAQKKAEMFGKTKVAATLGAIDKASAKIGSVTGAAKAFAGKSFRAALSMADKASSVIGDVTGAARSFAGKTFSAAVKIVDYATTPLRKIKESLFSIKTLIGTIALGFAGQKLVMNPINLADQYSSAKIGFSTLLGEAEGQKMMDKIDEFAEKTPFKTSGVISNVQKMMAYGWDASRVISDMETIGDAAAATGKGDEGLSSIVYALSEIRSKGKLSTQELNQLASAGIKAKQYLAEGLGFGSDDAGMAKLAEALEDGAIGANQAIELILQGMEEFDGMMDKTANETVEGLKSQIEDAFEINVFRRWGQGLQDGAKKGLGYVVDLLDSGKDGLKAFGDTVYEIGKEISNWGADKLEKFVKNLTALTQSDAFKNASLADKIKMIWNGTIMDPLKRWWNSDEVQSWIEEKKKWLAEKAAGWGESLGKGLTTGLLALFGVDVSGVVEGGVNVGASFAKGFAEGFDGSAVTNAIVDAIGNVWDALPGWAKFLLGSYGVGKAVSGIGSVMTGIGTIAGGAMKLGSTVAPVIGSTGNAMVQGTGLLNMAANFGYASTGGAAASALTPGMAAALGGIGIAGGTIGAVSAIKGGVDLYQSYKARKAYKSGDNKFGRNKMEADAKAASGWSTLGATATGAALGTMIMPGVGTAIGAGIGGIVGWIQGDKWAKQTRESAANLEAAKYSTQTMKDAIKDTELSAEELQQIFESACWEDMEDRFGEIELSMAEIQKLSAKVFEKETPYIKKYTEATQKAEESLKKYQSAYSDMDRLNFDMMEHTWKMNMGLEDKLSDEEISSVKSRVQNYIDSAEQLISDDHYQFNAAVELIMQPKDGEDNSTYNSIINSGNELYADMQAQLDEHAAELTAKYDLFLKDGKITADEQKILDELQGKIAEIMDKISDAETEASFELAKIKFKTSDMSAESFEQFQNTLQSDLNNYISEQDQALELSISRLVLKKNNGDLTEDQYQEQLKALLGDYNTNIEEMTANVNKIQLEGISEAFEGTGTVEELQTAINELIAEGENPLELTFSDLDAKLDIGDDVLSEEGKENFTNVMQKALESAMSGDNALKTKAEVDPTYVAPDEEKLTAFQETMYSDLESKLGGSEDDPFTITPQLDVTPEIAVDEEGGTAFKDQITQQFSSYLTGENSLSVSADAHTRLNMLGAEGNPLSEEASAGMGTVQSAVNTAAADPLSASSTVNVTLDWNITNPTANIGVSTSGGTATATISSATNNANGGFINNKILSWIGEEGPEAIIPLVPGRRARGLKLWEEVGRRLGVQYHAEGGIVGGDSAPIPAYDGEVQTGRGDQKIEINMGGVTIEINADPDKSMVENIEDQEQEIAEKVAAIFKNVFSAQFANMPVKAGT